jgi:hypothetical protein
MKVKFKAHKLFCLFLCCLNKELMLNYSPVSDFCKSYPEVQSSFIYGTVKEFVDDEKGYIEKYKLLLLSVEEDERLWLKSELRILVKSFQKELDFPGDKNLVLFKMENIFKA